MRRSTSTAWLQCCQGIRREGSRVCRMAEVLSRYPWKEGGRACSYMDQSRWGGHPFLSSNPYLVH